MNNDRIGWQWKSLQESMQQQWGKLTCADFAVADGNIDYRVGKAQERYGIARDQAEAEVWEFSSGL